MRKEGNFWDLQQCFFWEKKVYLIKLALEFVRMSILTWMKTRGIPAPLNCAIMNRNALQSFLEDDIILNFCQCVFLYHVKKYCSPFFASSSIVYCTSLPSRQSLVLWLLHVVAGISLSHGFMVTALQLSNLG